MVRLRFSLFALTLAMPAFAQDTPPAAPAPPIMREVSPGVFELGKMRLNKTAGSLTFPGKLNMEKGLLEYLICTPQGPTHESLLTTEVQPSDLHFGMLLLGAKGAGIFTPAPADAPPAQIDAEYLKRAPRLQGDNIVLIASWKDAAGKIRSNPVEAWVLNTSTRKAATRGPWIYTGSMFNENVFLAQAQGIHASVITNPAALINNPRKGSENDQTWEVNEKTVPPLDTPLEIIITLQPAPTP